jgi:hypothetical protein
MRYAERGRLRKRRPGRIPEVTPEALEMYRTGYKKWLERFSRDMYADPKDVRILERALVRIRTRE